jgi:hypothetical protein
MLCPRCGKENPEEQTLCSACGAPLSQAGGRAPLGGLPEAAGPPREPSGQSAPSRTSGLAIASLVVGIVGLLTVVVPVLVALPLGIIALVQIGRSQGRLSGKGPAIAGICLGGCSLLLLAPMAAMVFPVLMRARESARKVQCMANVKQLAIELQMYQSDWGVLPDGATRSESTADYARGLEHYVCPSAAELRCGYAYNSALSRLDPATIASPEQTVALFESDRGWNAAGDQSLLCPKPRHLRGDNWGFADGHAKWYARGGTPAGMVWEPKQGP